MKLDMIVEIVNKEKSLSDPQLQPMSKAILAACDCTGVINQIQNGLNYVSFYDESGNRITQVFKDDEIKERA